MTYQLFRLLNGQPATEREVLAECLALWERWRPPSDLVRNRIVDVCRLRIMAVGQPRIAS